MTFHIYPSAARHSHWIFAFYGFGQQAKVFDRLAQSCSDKYGFVIIDLPYEELNEIPGKKAFSMEIGSFIESNHIRQITGVSYSMGCRYNLLLAELLPEYVKKIILLAPDGILINRWYRLATSGFIGKHLFKYLMQHPALYLKILQGLYRARLLPANLFGFIKWHVRNRVNSMKVYHAWMNMKNMIPDLQQINRHQRQYSILLFAFFGRHDFVINEKVMQKLSKEIPAAEIILIEKDHNLLDDSLFQHLAAYL